MSNSRKFKRSMGEKERLQMKKVADRIIKLEKAQRAGKDPRIVHGARCSWWDSADRAASQPRPDGHGLPCCPYCFNVLYECPSEQEWYKGARAHEAQSPDPGYVAFLEFIRGRPCHPTLQDARDAYNTIQSNLASLATQEGDA